MITLKQYAGSLITPKDDAIIYDLLIHQNGIIGGCTVTHLGGNQLRVAAGRGIIMGRSFVIEEETISATLSSSGTRSGRLLIRIDLSNPSAPITFVTQQASALPALVQEDINGAGSIYEFELARYAVTTLAVSALTNTAEQVSIVAPISAGGTGATTAAGARGNLGAMAQSVYDPAGFYGQLAPMTLVQNKADATQIATYHLTSSSFGHTGTALSGGLGAEAYCLYVSDQQYGSNGIMQVTISVSFALAAAGAVTLSLSLPDGFKSTFDSYGIGTKLVGASETSLITGWHIPYNGTTIISQGVIGGLPGGTSVHVLGSIMFFASRI